MGQQEVAPTVRSVIPCRKAPRGPKGRHIRGAPVSVRWTLG